MMMWIRSSAVGLVIVLAAVAFESCERTKNKVETTLENKGQARMVFNTKNNTFNKKFWKPDQVKSKNQKTNKNFKHTSKVTQRHIRARLAEGFTVSDFKQVIDNKCNDWLRDQKMKEYLRPETLFGTKFESYLNSKTTTTKQTGPYIDSCGLRVL